MNRKPSDILLAWPAAWIHGQLARQAAATAVAAAFAAFLDDLRQKGRSPATIANHVRHLDQLGEMITTFLAADPQNLAKGVGWYFANLMADGNGPVPPGMRKKAEIQAYQGTCRQLIRFVRQQRLAQVPATAAP